MSPISQVQCPNCHAPTQAQVEQLIDVSQNSAMKVQLLSGSLNSMQCPACSFEWQIATPLVYHDAEKELLLTFVPIEASLPKNEQERQLGRLINQVTNSLPLEKRKAYLLQPQAVFTFQGLIERILEGDGVTREELDAQRATMQLLETVLRLPDDGLETFAREHDEEMDERFFQLASLTLQSTQDERAREMAAKRVDALLRLTTFGEKLLAQEAEIKAAAESLREFGESLDQQKILTLLIDAPNEERVSAIVSMIRPALDYAFFQMLTDKLDAAEDSAKPKLEDLRKHILELTEEIDKIQQAQAARAGALLQSLVDAPDLDQALMPVIPVIDELFMSILQANIRAAQERNDPEALKKLNDIDLRIRELIRQSLPPGLQLAQQLIETEDIEIAQKLVEDSVELIDQDCLGTLLQAAQRMGDSENKVGAERMRKLHRLALRASMRLRMQQD